MMLRSLALVSALSAALVATAVACGGSDSGTGSTSSAVATNFDGVYATTTAGDIESISFTHGREYLLMPTGCSQQSCAEIGTYTIDAAKGVLVLTTTTGSRRSLSLKVIATERAQATVAKTTSFALHLRDLIEKDASDDDLVEDGGSSLISLIQQLINLIKEAAVAGQELKQLFDGNGDAGSSSAAADEGSDDEGSDDAGAAASGLCADGGTSASCAIDCRKTLPTSTSSVAEVVTYFKACPKGPLTGVVR